MAVPTEIPELAALKEALEAHEEAGDTLEQAARLVSSLTDPQTVPALDGILEASHGSDQAGAAAEIRDAADQLVRQTEMLEREVTRFLSLSASQPKTDKNPT